jgi:hypothetical protein
MKKLLLSLMMILLPMMAMAVEVEIDGLRYELVSKTKEAEVAGKTSQYSENIVIPEKINYEGEEYLVKSIKQYAFSNSFSLISVAIPNSVTSIGSNAFSYCSKLTTVTLPNNITRIENFVFSGCI